MNLSNFGQRLSAGTGIQELMDDLGHAMANADDNTCMLGGGNPARVPEIEQAIRSRMRNLLADTAFDHAIGTYDTPQGKLHFIDDLAALLNRQFGWNIDRRNVALTNGSQSAFFCLFNMLAGAFPDGRTRRILLPLAPEYLGYADQGISDGLFYSEQPRIEQYDDHEFKYFIDFDRLNIDDSLGAICVSRPTNPTGNVLTDDEIEQLRRIAAQHHVPLLIDNAYGAPFPQILFSDISPVWDENIVLVMSLSKFGLPAARTGIVVARPELIDTLSGITAVISLATGGLGPSLSHDLVASGDIIRLSQDTIRPFYQSRRDRALAELHAAMDDDLPWHVHRCEGTMFLWLWFEKFPITTATLYERLKARNVLVVPGHYFFPGYSGPWTHRHECIRINYGQEPEAVARGIAIIADEVRKAYSEK